jgi:hypothetical protein
MPTNPFSGIITSGMKDLHKNMIDALLEDDALTRPCQLIYGDTKFTLCPNCLYDPKLKRSSNRYQAGGPVPFPSGQLCPYCRGIGMMPDEQTETLYMAVLWNYKDWFPMGNTSSPVGNTPHFGWGKVQTMSKFDATYSKLVRTKEIIVDTDIEATTRERFVREGAPFPCGFGASNYVFTMWAKTE